MIPQIFDKYLRKISINISEKVGEFWETIQKFS